MAQIARTVAEVIAGEAVSGSSQDRWNDMLNIASVIANRAAMLGVSPEDVVSVQNQFNAYNKALPSGTGSLVGMAQAALDQVAATGPVNNATFYATPAAVDNLPDGLAPETETAGHQFFSDPAMRAIITAQGPIRPDPNALPSVADLDPVQKAISAPYEANGLLNGVTSLTAAPATAVTSQSMPAIDADPAFGTNGLLTGNFPASSFVAPSTAPMGALATGDVNMGILGPTMNSFGPLAEAGVPGGEVASTNERMGIAPEGFDASRFAGPVDPAASQMAQVMQTPSAILDAPEARPNVNSFADLAAAAPVQAPMGVQGVLGQMAQPNLAAAANVPMSASVFSPAISNPTANSFAEVAAAAPVAAPAGVLGSAELGSTPALSAEATATPTSTNPVGATAANNSFADLAAAGPMAAPVSATPTGILGSTPSLAASATPSVNTGLLSGYQATPTNTPAENAFNSILSQPSSLTSPTSIEGTTRALTTQAPTSSILSSAITPNYQQYQSFVPSDVQAPAVAATDDLGASYNEVTKPEYQGLVNASFPSVPTTTIVPDSQPNVTVAGPVNTPAVTQAQSNLSGSFPAAPSKPTGLLGGLVNKGTLTGGILGSLALGPAGGIIGGLLGNQISKNGGLTGLLSGSPMSINNIGAGLANVSSVYGGAPAGTQAYSNDGGTVTSLGGGWTAVTGPSGVTTSFGPNNTHAGWFGGDLNGDNQDKDIGGGVDVGGFSPGLF